VFAVRAAHAFDGENFRAGGGTVLMEEGRIVGVEPMGYEPPSDCQLVDYGNATVLPGLIDTHVHLVGNSGVMALERVAGYSPEEIDEVVSESLRRQLAAGVTTVRDLGDRHFNVVERRDAQWQVDDRLPWILASGPPITTPGGHCGYLGGEVSGADEIVAAVRERVERRVDVVKVMASGGMVTTGTDMYTPQFSIEELRLLVEQTHAAGFPVTAHAHAAAAVDQAVAVGVDGIEHATYLIRSGEGGPAQAQATEEQLAALAASGIAVCPTLDGHTIESLAPASQRIQQALGAGVTPEVFIEMRMSILRRMTAFGVRLISGTDAGVAHIKAHGSYADADRAWPGNRNRADARRCLQQRSHGDRARPVEGASSARVRRRRTRRRRRPGRRPQYPAACTAGRAPGCAGPTTVGAVLKVLTQAHGQSATKTQSRSRHDGRARSDTS
jgi:imidazolonepropionase-like amidohydrolase